MSRGSCDEECDVSDEPNKHLRELDLIVWCNFSKCPETSIQYFYNMQTDRQTET